MAVFRKNVEGDEPGSGDRPRGRRDAGGGSMQPSLTPMIDTTFLLLLFFLLTFTFRQAEGQIPGSLPKRLEGPPLDLPIHIRVRPLGRDRALFDLVGAPEAIERPGQLYEKLPGRKQAVGTPAEAMCEVPVIIDPRGDVVWRWVAEAFNQAVRAKFRFVTLQPPAR